MSLPTKRRRRRSRPVLPPDELAPAVAPRTTALQASLVLLPLLCVLLGGGTARWSQGVVLVFLGALLLVAPPRQSLGWELNAILAAFFALALTAFLPARWFMGPAWRAAAGEDYGVVLPGTLSPQPWLTLESCLLFLAGICWFYRVSTVNWTSDQRLRAARLFGGGVVALAGLFLLLFKANVNVHIWPTERHFGPFPNRNQTANFLAVGALPVLACAQYAWREGRRTHAVFWMAGWLLIALAAFTSFSRASVILLFLGTAIYLIIQAERSRRAFIRESGSARSKLERLRGVAISVSVVAILLATFMLFGGETLNRLTPASAEATVSAVTTEFRLRIQEDALSMIAASPWCGLGLGNFASVFAIFRLHSALPARAIHPESDWLWLVSELGWLGLLLLLAGSAWLLRGIMPFRRTADRPIRTAAAVSLGVFAIHSFVDVSAHRLGTCFCVLLMLGLALRGDEAGLPGFRWPARWPAPVFRLLGLVLLLTGGIWVLEARGVLLLPGQEGVRRLQADAVSGAASHDYKRTVRDMDQALAWAPLDWELYFTRAGARIYSGDDPEEAVADFRRARYLEPFIGTLASDEARVMLAVGQPALAVNALVEACRREPARAGEFMDAVVSVAPHDPVFTREMWSIAGQTPLLILPFLNDLEPPVSGEFIASVVQQDPRLHRLTPEQQVRFFDFWARRGDAANLAALMAEHTGWQAIGWRWWAEACAKGGAYQQACGIVTRFVTAPKVPPFSRVEDVPRVELERDAAGSPGNAALALRAYVAAKKAGDLPAALVALRRETVQPDAPPYFHYLEAQEATAAGNWPGAWGAWSKFLHATRIQEKGQAPSSAGV